MSASSVSKTLFAPRLGAAYRINEKTVFRAGYGITYNPLPWSRPLRGFYPLTIGFSQNATVEQLRVVRAGRGHSAGSAARHQHGADPAAAQRRNADAQP